MATLLFAPAGIVALVYAAQVHGKKASGDVEGAVRASKRARAWCWVAFGATVVLIVIGIVGALFEPYDPYYDPYGY